MSVHATRLDRKTRHEPARRPAVPARPAQPVLPGDLDAGRLAAADPDLVDTDGEHILINSVAGFQKIRNIERDPRVAVTVSDPQNPARYFAVRGRVLNVTADGAADHIEKLAQRYLGGPYPWYGGRDQTRLLITIEAHKISGTG